MTKGNEPPLQPLRIPSGWEVSFNTFNEIEARFASYDETSWNFKEDMLLLSNPRLAIIIDIGWRPSFRATGRFYLKAVRDLGHEQGGDWEKPLRQLRTQSRRKVVETLEKWLQYDWKREVRPK